MFCPQCGTPREPQLKFCRACGLKLADRASLPATLPEAEPEHLSRREAAYQLRQLKGTRALIIGAASSPLALFTVMLAASAHGPEADMFGVFAFFWTALSLCTSGWGLIQLLRGRFFKTFKERRVRAEAALLAQANSPNISSRPRELAVPTVENNRRVAPGSNPSVIEPTTRKLQSAASDSGKIR